MAKTNDHMKVPFVVSTIGSALMLLSVFLPYATATADSVFRRHPDEVSDGVRAGDLANISMFKFAQLYGKMARRHGDTGLAATVITVVSIIAVCALTALIFSIVKRGVPVVVFAAIASGIFLLLNWDFTDRGVVPSDSFDWGFGYYLFHIAAVMALIGGIWMIVAKHRVRKLTLRA